MFRVIPKEQGISKISTCPVILSRMPYLEGVTLCKAPNKILFCFFLTMIPCWYPIGITGVNKKKRLDILKCLSEG
jgi:hypothetical protein